jgi:hypothetical protein
MHKMIRRVAAVGGFARVIAASTTWTQDNVRGRGTIERVAKRALELNPQSGLSHYWFWTRPIGAGRPTEALETVERERHVAFRRLGLALSQLTLGRRAESDAGLRQLIKIEAAGSACQIEEAYALSWRSQRRHLNGWSAYSQRDSGLSVARSDLLLRNLHGDRQWQPFLKKMGLTG